MERDLSHGGRQANAVSNVDSTRCKVRASVATLENVLHASVQSCQTELINIRCAYVWLRIDNVAAIHAATSTIV